MAQKNEDIPWWTAGFAVSDLTLQHLNLSWDAASSFPGSALSQAQTPQVISDMVKEAAKWQILHSSASTARLPVGSQGEAYGEMK